MMGKLLIFCFINILAYAQAYAAIAVVQAEYTYTGATPQAKAFSTNNTAGNLIVVGIQDGTASACTDPTVVDSAGNTYAQASPAVQQTNGVQWIYYAKNIAAGANTVTVTGGTNCADLGFHMMEVSGLSTTSPVSAITSGTGTVGVVYSAPNVVITKSSAFIYAIGGKEDGGAAAFVAGSGYTLSTEAANHWSADEYQIVTAPGTYTVDITGPTTAQWLISAVVFVPDFPGTRLNNFVLTNGVIQ